MKHRRSAKLTNPTILPDVRVEVASDKHTHRGQQGKVTARDKGDVTVKLDSGEIKVFRAGALRDITPDPYDDARF